MNPSPSPTARRFARLRLVIAWLFIAGFVMLAWRGLTLLANMMVLAYALLHPQTHEERTAALRRSGGFIPLVLLVIGLLLLMFSPAEDPVMGRKGWFGPVFFGLVLLWMFILDVRLYCRLPPSDALSEPNRDA